MLDEAIASLQTAVRSPLHRFAAAAALGRVVRAARRVCPAIDRFEQAAEARAPATDEGRELLDDLGCCSTARVKHRGRWRSSSSCRPMRATIATWLPASIASRVCRPEADISFLTRILFAAYFLEAGLILVVAPWSGFWDRNLFLSLHPPRSSRCSRPRLPAAPSRAWGRSPCSPALQSSLAWCRAAIGRAMSLPGSNHSASGRVTALPGVRSSPW